MKVQKNKVERGGKGAGKSLFVETKRQGEKETKAKRRRICDHWM